LLHIFLKCDVLKEKSLGKVETLLEKSLGKVGKFKKVPWKSWKIQKKSLEKVAFYFYH